MRVSAHIALSAAFLCSAQIAHAGAFDVFGFGSRGLSLGGAMTACADDHSAVFYNPAALTLGRRAHLGADLYTARPLLDIDLARPTQDPALNPADVSAHSGLSVGARLPLWPRVSVGFAVGVPFDGVLDLKLLDPQVPQWTRYDALPRKLHLIGGISARPVDWLHLGVGVQSLAQIAGGATFEMDLANEVITRRDATVELLHTASPTAGLLLELPFTPGLRLGASWRGPLELSFDLPILFDFGQDADVLLAVAGVTLFVPHQISAGLSQDLRPLIGWPLRVSLDARWALWSQTPDPSFDLAIDFRGDAPEGLGLGEALDFEIAERADPGFRDTLTLSGGLEWEVSRGLKLRGGYAFRPTSLGPQRGLTNYVDTNAHLIGLGLGITRPDPLEEAQRDATVEVSLHMTILEPVEVEKVREDDRVGDYSAGGEVLTLSVTLRHDL